MEKTQFFEPKFLYDDGIDVLKQPDIKRGIHIYNGEGFVQLYNVSPRFIPPGYTADAYISNIARASTQTTGKKYTDEITLMRRLMREEHTSPFEHASLTFFIKAPLAMIVQLLRHRTAKINQFSHRYSEANDEFFVPDLNGLRIQATTNKQSSVSDPNAISDSKKQDLIDRIRKLNQNAVALYDEMGEHKIAREVRRFVLPVSNYSTLYYTLDLHNFLRFLWLRKDPAAQKEVRDIADAMMILAQQIFPETIKAFEEYKLNAIKLSEFEIVSIKEKSSKLLNTSNLTEQREYLKKLEMLGLNFEPNFTLTLDEFKSIQQKSQVLICENLDDEKSKQYQEKLKLLQLSF